MEEFFTNKFDQKIKINSAYLSAHRKPNYKESIPDEITGLKSQTFYEAFGSFILDVFEYAIVFDFLKQWGVSTNWNTALDIGGHDGTISKLLSGEGKAKTSDCIEVYDYQTNYSIKKMKRLYSIWKFLKNSPLKNKRQVLRLTKAFESRCIKFGYRPNSSSTYWNLKFKNEPIISDYIIDDVYKIKKKYDFISSFLALPYFNHKKLFKKVSELLNEDGIFVFLTDYWWWPVNSSGIIGYFPYAAQRLEKDDFIKYLEIFHKNELEDIMKHYDYFDHGNDEKPTITQYIDEAEKNDLSLIGYHRFMPTDSTSYRTPLPPHILDQFQDTNLKDVLENIHSFRRDVKLEDLKTSYVLAAFVKKGKREKISERIKELQSDGYGVYRKNE